MTTTELKPSIELLDAIRVIQQKYGESKELVYNAYQLAIRDGFTPIQARDFLFAELPFLSESTIRKALPAEAKDQSKVRTNFAVNLSQKPEQKDSNIVNITTKANIQDADLVKDDPTSAEEPVGKKELEYMDKIPEEELPTELELLKIENEQLKDALHKTEQFKPANKLEEPKPFPFKDTEEILFAAIQKKADGVHAFYYDAYGIDLFKNRELSQLKNSGVKTFKRLYFEV